MVGFTGDPFVGCVDIDECSLPELNTCPGGMNAGGFSHDVYIKDQYDYGTKYLWPVDSDGYSQVCIKDLFFVTNYNLELIII